MNMVIIGNLISFIGCLLMVGIGFIRKKERILGVQCLQFSIMGVSNLLLGALSGTISNVVSIVRNLVFARITVTTPIKLVFIALQVVLSLGVLQNGVLEWLPVLAAAIFTWFLDAKSEVTLKTVIIGTSAMWVVYDLSHMNFVAMTFDVLTICSNIIGIYMLKKGTK